VWIRVSLRATTAVAVSALLCGSYFAFTAHQTATAPSALGSNMDTASLLSSGDPQAIIRAADHYYWLNNGPAAGPLYARAEELFFEKRDERNAVYAKIGRLRSNAETSLPRWFRHLRSSWV